MIYHETLKYQAEKNWANSVDELRSKYNLPLSDENVMEKNSEWSDQACGISFTNWDVLC